MSGHDLDRESGLGEQKDHRRGEMPLPVRLVQPLIGAKRSRDGPGASHSGVTSLSLSLSLSLFTSL